MRYEGSQYDFTSFDEQNSSWHPTIDFLYEEEIDPDQIGEYKIKKHQDWIVTWLSSNPQINMSFHEVWRIRETCIQGLSAG